MPEAMGLLLADACEAVVDCEHKTAPTQTSGIPSIRTTNIKGGRLDLLGSNRVSEATYRQWTLRLEPKPGDLILAREAPVGEVGIVPPGERVCLGQRTVLIRTNELLLHSRYLLYLLLTEQMRHLMLSRAEGSTVPHLNMSDIRSLRLPPLPPVGHQQEVAAILGALDDKIELNRRMNQTLDTIAGALFKAWFEDFEPVRARAADRAPQSAPSQLAASFPRRLDDTDFGELPMGWRFAAVSEVADVNSCTLTARDHLERIDYIEISEVKFGDVDKVVRYDRGGEPGRARRRLRHGDTVLSTVRPDRGSHFLCLDPSPSLVASTGFAVVTPRSVPWSFLHVALTRPEFFSHLGRLADGAAYPAVSYDVIAAWQVPIPDEERILDAFHGVCGPLFEMANNNRKEAHTLRALRNNLLPKLLSGEVTVRQAETLVEAAV